MASQPRIASKRAIRREHSVPARHIINMRRVWKGRSLRVVRGAHGRPRGIAPSIHTALSHLSLANRNCKLAATILHWQAKVVTKGRSQREGEMRGVSLYSFCGNENR